MKGENMRRFNLVIPALSLLATSTLVSSCAKRSDPSAMEALADHQNHEWHRIMIRNQPVGYQSIAKLPQSNGHHTTRAFIKLTVARGGVPLTLEATSEVEEQSDGQILGFFFEQKLSKRATRMRGKVSGKTIEVDIVQGARSRKIKLPFDPSSRGPMWIEQQAITRLKQEGDRLDLKIFAPELQQCTRQIVTLGPVESTDFPNGSRKLRRQEVLLALLPGHPTIQWVDDECNVHKSTISMMGMHFVTFRSTREEVLAIDYRSPPEIYFAMAIPVRKRIPHDAGRALYRLKLKAGSKEQPESLKLPAAAGQKVVKREPGAWLLEVLAVTPNAPLPLPLPQDEETDPFLEPNYNIQSDDRAIIDLARKIAGDETDSWEAAKRLERWVHKSIKKKNMQTGFATAAEVAERLEGDCTEHAVLLAALSRAAGIPARAVAGLLYYKQNFVGHMWTEVFCGEWVPLDGTIGKGIVGADHIALTASSLSSASISQLFIGLATVFGNLEIEVVETK